MSKVAFGRMKTYADGRHALYIPARITEDPAWPFKPNDILSARIENGKVIYERVPESMNLSVIMPYGDIKLVPETVTQTLLQR